MNYEESRLRTFTSWPSDAPVDAIRIANGGFFYTGQGMEVQCFSCGGKISEWIEGDHVMAKHRRLDPRCPFIVNPFTSGNVPKLPNNSHANNNNIVNAPAEQQPPQPQTERTEQYLTEAERLSSFVNWPISHVVTPESLAKAGFYFLREADKVKCAFCSGIVGFWEIGDEPKQEHTRHFPFCSFVLSNFGAPDASTSSTDLQDLGIQTHKGIIVFIFFYSCVLKSSIFKANI